MLKKITHAIIFMILPIGILVSANFAQNITGGDGFASAFVYSGLETTAGAVDQASGIRYGNTFALSSRGEWDSRYLTVSINHQETFRGASVTGGSWTLAVFNENGYSETLYGEVLSGDIQEITDGNGGIIGKRTRINLQSTGGTGAFTDKARRRITDSLELTTEYRFSQTSGVGLLNF
jgi:hypothetical protein